jgi:hypothetical protein
MPELFLLLGIDADHWLPSHLVRLDLLVDIAELGIPVRMLLALQRLGVGLQAEALLAQQPAHRRRGDRITLAG